MKYYAGIGSRQTPPEILSLMTQLARKLELNGYVLRSGGAGGADQAFANGVKELKQIFIPWNGFNSLQSEFVGASEKAFRIAEQIHPAWNKCSQGAKKLHARNIHQVLGWDIDPKTYSTFIICWTPNAQEVGGTATAIRLAKKAKIKVFNLANPTHLQRIKKWIAKGE